MGVDQSGAAMDDLDAGITEQAFIDAVQALDFGILVVDKGAPIKTFGFGVPAEGGGIGEVVMEVGGIDEHLLGDTADIDAGAAHEHIFGDRHAGAIISRESGGADPAGAGANDKQVVFVVGHGFAPHGS